MNNTMSLHQFSFLSQLHLFLQQMFILLFGGGLYRN